MQLPFMYSKIQVVSVEITEDNLLYYGVKGIKNKEVVSILESESFDNVEELLSWLSKTQATYLHFFGKGVLYRAVEPDPDFVDKILVNANKDDFYINHIDVHTLRHVAFARKNNIQPVLDALSSINDSILDIFLGPLPLLLDEIKDLTSSTCGGYLIKREENNISLVAVEHHSSSTFSGYELNNGVFAGIVCYSKLMDLSLSGCYINERLKEKRVNLRDKRQFEIIGLFTLVFYLSTLVANYIYQGTINDENAEIESEIMVFSDNLTKIDLIDQEIIRKTQLIQTSGIMSSQYSSYYLDQIGVSLAQNNIKLSSIELFPLESKLKPKIKPEFNQEIALISGSTQSSGELDNWIKILNRFEWINRIEIINFDKTEKSNSHFILKITLQ